MTTNDDRRRRIEARYRALGTREPACTTPGCMETDPFALTGKDIPARGILGV